MHARHVHVLAHIFERLRLQPCWRFGIKTRLEVGADHHLAWVHDDQKRVLVVIVSRRNHNLRPALDSIFDIPNNQKKNETSQRVVPSCYKYRIQK
jgi:hypothetical protein